VSVLVALQGVSDIVDQGTLVIAASFTASEVMTEMVTLQVQAPLVAAEALGDQAQETAQVVPTDQEAVADAGTAVAGLTAEDLEALAQAADELLQAQQSDAQAVADQGADIAVVVPSAEEDLEAAPEVPGTDSVPRIVVPRPREDIRDEGTLVMYMTLSGEGRLYGFTREEEELLVLELV
jgi:hypothetical protein